MGRSQMGLSKTVLYRDGNLKRDRPGAQTAGGYGKKTKRQCQGSCRGTLTRASSTSPISSMM